MRRALNVTRPRTHNVLLATPTATAAISISISLSTRSRGGSIRRLQRRLRRTGGGASVAGAASIWLRVLIAAPRRRQSNRIACICPVTAFLVLRGAVFWLRIRVSVPVSRVVGQHVRVIQVKTHRARPLVVVRCGKRRARIAVADVPDSVYSSSAADSPLDLVLPTLAAPTASCESDGMGLRRFRLAAAASAAHRVHGRRPSPRIVTMHRSCSLSLA